MAGGGDDLPVVALMLLGLALLERERRRGSSPPRTGPLLAAGAVLGLAAATKQTGWFLLPFLLAAAWQRGGRRYTAILAASAGFV